MSDEVQTITKEIAIEINRHQVEKSSVDNPKRLTTPLIEKAFPKESTLNTRQNVNKEYATDEKKPQADAVKIIQQYRLKLIFHLIINYFK